MVVIIFAEDKVLKFLGFIYDRQAIQFMVPDNGIGFAQSNPQFTDNQVLVRSHEFGHGFI